jgi:hypothetical protein
MLRLMMLAGLAALALSGGPARADCEQIEDDPAQLRPCGMTWSQYYQEQDRAVREQYRTVDRGADQDQDSGRRQRHR